MASKIFFSNPSDIPKSGHPSDFADLFPIAAVHESGAFLLRGEGVGVGVLLLGDQEGGRFQARVMSEATSWMTDLSLAGASLTVTSYRRTPGGNGTKDIARGTVLGLVLSGVDLDDGAKPKGFSLGGSELRYESVAFETLRRIQILADELIGRLRKAKIILRRENDVALASQVARALWRSDSPTAKFNSGHDPVAFFGDGWSVYSGRLHWIEGQSVVRLMFTAKSASEDSVALIREMTRRDQLGAGAKEIMTRFARSDDILDVAGIHFVSVSSGGVQASSRIHGVSGVGAFREKESEDVRRIASDARSKLAIRFDRAWGRVFRKKGTEDARRELERTHRKSIKMTRGFLAEASITDVFSDKFGTWGEAAALQGFERRMLEQLFADSGGIMWGAVDSVWLETLYAIVPGAMRMDTYERMRLHDLICLEMDGAV